MPRPLWRKRLEPQSFGNEQIHSEPARRTEAAQVMINIRSEHGTFDAIAERQANRATREVSKERIANEKRERARWGAALEDVRFLRRRDFVIHKSGVGDAYCVCDNRLITVAELRKRASRERRLLGLEPYVANPIPYTAPILQGEALEAAIREAATVPVEPENVVRLKAGGKDVSGATVPCALRVAA